MNAMSRDEGRSHLPLLDMLIKKIKLVITLSFRTPSVCLFIYLFIFEETKLKLKTISDIFWKCDLNWLIPFSCELSMQIPNKDKPETAPNKTHGYLFHEAKLSN